jgi:hypothetical protein
LFEAVGKIRLICELTGKWGKKEAEKIILFLFGGEDK